MYKSMKAFAAGVGVAAVLAAGVNVATQASDHSTSTFSSGATAGETITMSTDATTLETASFQPVQKAEVPCGFATTGSC